MVSSPPVHVVASTLTLWRLFVSPMSIATKAHVGEILMRKAGFKALLALVVVTSAFLLLGSQRARILYYLYVVQSEPNSIQSFMAFEALLELGEDEVPPAGALVGFELPHYSVSRCRRLTRSKMVMEVMAAEAHNKDAKHLVYLLLERKKGGAWRIVVRYSKFLG